MKSHLMFLYVSDWRYLTKGSTFESHDQSTGKTVLTEFKMSFRKAKNKVCWVFEKHKNCEGPFGVQNGFISVVCKIRKNRSSFCKHE